MGEIFTGPTVNCILRREQYSPIGSSSLAAVQRFSESGFFLYFTPSSYYSCSVTTPDQHGKGKQSPAQSTTGHQAVVRRDSGVKDGVWKQLELDKSRAQAVETKATENINRHDGALRRATARQNSKPGPCVERGETKSSRRNSSASGKQPAFEWSGRWQEGEVAAEFRRIRPEQETKRREEQNMQRRTWAFACKASHGSNR
ncbi:hypothetical protein BS47DRAFT_1389893 [Hydnum rufescens UP504]|uniref:Uncharacterized protein n=1 Tax=Hydnum rufescens UP504 TaxID=1448309 RepID=A0A9P6B475_9AGAM|nr:hypothetical protein BS47DRAFT_1389893 [Hydnum rufescens UP504]